MNFTYRTIHAKGISFLTFGYQCNCEFYTAMELAYKHIFALCKHIFSKLQGCMLYIQWTHDYSNRNSHQVFSTNAIISMNVSTIDRLPALKVLSWNEKYRKIFAIAQKLVNVVSHISIRVYSYAI